MNDSPSKVILPPGVIRQFRYGGFVVALVGLYAAGVLSIGHLFDLPLPCGASRGCLSVAAHPASKILGLPIAYLGVGFFLLQAGLVLRGPADRRLWLGATILAGAGTAISVGLLIYAKVVIQAICPWCVVSGVAMAALLGWFVSWRKLAFPFHPLRPVVVWPLGLATAIAVGVQAGRMERASLTPAISLERLAALPTSELLDPGKALGPSTAPVTVTVFADFFCPACRASIASLRRYQNANPDGVRVVFRHRPLAGIAGHETSEVAAAVSELAAEEGKFWEFADAIHSRRAPLNGAEYLALMERLGFERRSVEIRLENPRDPLHARVARDVALAERLAINATPTFIVQVGKAPPIATSERGLSKLLNSTAVISFLAESARSRIAQR